LAAKVAVVWHWAAITLPLAVDFEVTLTLTLTGPEDRVREGARGHAGARERHRRDRHVHDHGPRGARALGALLAQLEAGHPVRRDAERAVPFWTSGSSCPYFVMTFAWLVPAYCPVTTAPPACVAASNTTPRDRDGHASRDHPNPQGGFFGAPTLGRPDRKSRKATPADEPGH
jgi:hypothetical protein